MIRIYPDHRDNMILTSHRDNDISPPLARRRDHEEGRHSLLYGREHLLQESRGEHPEAAGEGEEAKRGKCCTCWKGKKAVVKFSDWCRSISNISN